MIEVQKTRRILWITPNVSIAHRQRNAEKSSRLTNKVIHFIHKNTKQKTPSFALNMSKAVKEKIIRGSTFLREENLAHRCY